MESLIQVLYDKSHRLLHYGEEGYPAYADEYTSLNREVDNLSTRLFIYVPRSQEEEALFCFVLLMSYAATYTGGFGKEEKLNSILSRVDCLLFGNDPRWPGKAYPDCLLRCQIALYAYTFTYDENLLHEVDRLIEGWEGRLLNQEEMELLDLYTILKT